MCSLRFFLQDRQDVQDNWAKKSYIGFILPNYPAYPVYPVKKVEFVSAFVKKLRIFLQTEDTTDACIAVVVEGESVAVKFKRL